MSRLKVGVMQNSLRGRLVQSILPPIQWEIDALCAYLQPKTEVVVISGAGISTASGIPDYRYDLMMIVAHEELNGSYNLS